MPNYIPEKSTYWNEILALVTLHQSVGFKEHHTAVPALSITPLKASFVSGRVRLATDIFVPSLLMKQLYVRGKYCALGNSWFAPAKKF